MEMFDDNPHVEAITKIVLDFSKNPLKTIRNEMVEFVNCEENAENVLLSSKDLSKMEGINQDKIIPISEYFHRKLLNRLKKELKNKNKNKIMEIFLNLKEIILEKLTSIECVIKQLSENVVSNFLLKYENGLLNEFKTFKNEFEVLVSELANKTRLQKMENIITESVGNLINEFEILSNQLKEAINIPKENKLRYSIPTSFEFVDSIEINRGKGIPCANGIDVHPTKNIYIVVECNDGCLVIINQETNTEIKRVKLNNNSSGYTQNCLWNLSGDKIMVTTCVNPSIYIYNETGEKLKSIENTYYVNGYGAVWLSEMNVAVGYENGMVKLFNIYQEKEVGFIKLKGTYAWGMDCLDNSHLLVGDCSGTISNIDWEKQKIEWQENNWHLNGKSIPCIRLNQDKTKLVTCSEDSFIKMMNVQKRSMLWEFKLNNYCRGISWVPRELYVLAISCSNQLVALNSNNGTKIIEFHNFQSAPRSLKLNRQAKEILIGDNNGVIQKLIINQAQITKKLNT